MARNTKVIGWATKKIWPGPLDPAPWKHEYYAAVAVIFIWAVSCWLAEKLSFLKGGYPSRRSSRNRRPDNVVRSSGEDPENGRITNNEPEYPMRWVLKTLYNLLFDTLSFTIIVVVALRFDAPLFGLAWLVLFLLRNGSLEIQRRRGRHG